jgi:hypothetical protein
MGKVLIEMAAGLKAAAPVGEPAPQHAWPAVPAAKAAAAAAAGGEQPLNGKMHLGIEAGAKPAFACRWL